MSYPTDNQIHKGRIEWYVGITVARPSPMYRLVIPRGEGWTDEEWEEFCRELEAEFNAVRQG